MKQVYNPYLPSYEYVPDGEPHAFGDRTSPTGAMRVSSIAGSRIREIRISLRTRNVWNPPSREWTS